MAKKKIYKMKIPQISKLNFLLKFFGKFLDIFHHFATLHITSSVNQVEFWTATTKEIPVWSIHG